MLKLLLISLLSSSAHATPLTGATYRDFSGGLRDNVDASEIAPNESPDLQNVVLDNPVGSIKPRKGFEQCGITPSGSAATALYEWFKSDGSRRLIVSDGANIWETSDCQTFTAISVGHISNTQFQFSTVRGDLWAVKSDTHVIVWDGSTTTVLDAGANTPNPAPAKGTYIEFWKERVWIARSDSDPSGVSFSALTDDNGDDVTPSTGSAAWPATNLIFVDQDGKGPIFGIKAFRDKLYVFKNNGIWRIIFQDNFNSAVVRTLSSVGTRFHNSIVEIDGFLYFVGPDGVYAFDGDRSVRISDPITNAFSSLAQPISNTQFKQWTSNSDFSAGAGVRSATETLTGSLLVAATESIKASFTLSDQNVPENTELAIQGFIWKTSRTDKFSIASNRLKVDAAAATGGIGVLNPAISDFTDQEGRKYSFTYRYDGGADGNRCNMFLLVQSTDTERLGIGGQAGYNLTLPYDAGSSNFTLVRVSTHIADSTLITGANGDFNTGQDFEIAVTISSSGVFEVFIDDESKGTATDTTYQTGVGVDFFCGVSAAGTAQLDNFLETIYYSSETFTSDAFDATTVSSWSTFGVTDVTNGLTRNYSVRLAAAEDQLATASWANQAIGSLINGTTGQTWIQWKVDATNTDLKSLQIDDVTVNYIQGGSPSQNIYAAKADNRYWFAASSGSATSNNVVFVKSKSPSNAWSKYDLQLGPIVEFNDGFYGAASTHSAINVLQSGTNDNGKAINWYWTSRDEVWELPNNRKDLHEITVDFRKDTASNMAIGWSTDSGVSFSSRTVNMNGTGRGSKRLYLNGGSSLQFRFKLENITIDESATVTGFTGWARPWRIRE